MKLGCHVLLRQEQDSDDHHEDGKCEADVAKDIGEVGFRGFLRCWHGWIVVWGEARGADCVYA